MTQLRLATAADDACLRALLRDNGMPGWVDMSLQREPCYAAGQNHFGRDWAVLAEDRGETVGMYSAAVLPVCVNGAVEQLGYLGGLRVQGAHRRRIRHLREGYASIRPLAPVQPSLPWWFSVVADDNRVARRLLEAGLPGLPRYRPIGRYTTFALSTARGARGHTWRAAKPDELPALLAWHRAQATRQQLTPVLDEAAVHHLGLKGLWVHERAGQFLAMAMLWNQGAYKQVVAHRYGGPLRWLRPAYNAWARATQRVALPPPGTALGQSFIAFLTLAPELMADPRQAGDLMAGLLQHCPTPVAALGLHEGHPLQPALQRLAPLRYAAQVYAVEFDQPALLDGRPVQPEAALL